jgi:hypothetical protein
MSLEPSLGQSLIACKGVLEVHAACGGWQI